MTVVGSMSSDSMDGGVSGEGDGSFLLPFFFPRIMAFYRITIPKPAKDRGRAQKTHRCVGMCATGTRTIATRFLGFDASDGSVLV